MLVRGINETKYEAEPQDYKYGEADQLANQKKFNSVEHLHKMINLVVIMTTSIVVGPSHHCRKVLIERRVSTVFQRRLCVPAYLSGYS